MNPLENQQLSQNLTENRIIKEAIEATLYLYDPCDRSIYQPALYTSDKNVSLVSRILGLADLGALGMEGVESYHRKGSLLFLEENPDIIPLIVNGDIHNLDSTNPELYENIRQRLLKRACFQVDFAKSRLARYSDEVATFATDAMPILTHEVFQYLTPKTIQEIEAITPTDKETSVKNLIDFFELETYAKSAKSALTLL